MSANELNYITVVMASYNGSKYLSQQLDSILQQTLPPNEVVVVDDASTDESSEILRQYTLHYPQLKYYSNPVNIGVVKTFERALTLAKGEFIAFADQDDVWLPHKLEVLLANIGDAWMVHSDAVLVDKDLNIISDNYNKQYKSYKFNRKLDYLMHNNVTGCTMLINRKLLNVSLPFPDAGVMHDNYLALMAFHFNQIVYVNQPLILYRQHDENVTNILHLNYGKFIEYAKSKSALCKSLSSRDDFAANKREIIFVYEYYANIYKASLPSLKLLSWIWQSFSWKNFCGYLLLTCGSRKLAKFSYEVLNKLI
jgi:glycosyltransferase involved in cell wall biosynthesis